MGEKESQSDISTTTTESKNEPQKEPFKQKAIKYLKGMPKKYFITAFSGMAMGLFCTLIAGTILAQIGGWIGDNGFGNLIVSIANVAKVLMGAGIGVGIAHSFKSNKLVMFSAAVAGMVGAFSTEILNGTYAAAIAAFKPGNPIGAYIASVICIEISTLISGKTKLDIILVPLCTFAVALVCLYVAWPFIWLVNQLGKLIAIATNATPFVMGIVIAVIMGILLTMPTSSAAIWVAVASPVLAGYAPGAETAIQSAMLLAGGAATVGCACHMVGFAVASFRENRIGGLISQGLGTSMLQIPNIMRKPQIMLPMIISSAICGPLSTCVFKIRCGISGGGMGTSGLVGVFDCFNYTSGALGICGIILLMFVLPVILNLVISEFMRKKGFIKPEYLKLDL